MTSAYTDINTTFDPGGRVGQLVWRSELVKRGGGLRRQTGAARNRLSLIVYRESLSLTLIPR